MRFAFGLLAGALVAIQLVCAQPMATNNATNYTENNNTAVMGSNSSGLATFIDIRIENLKGQGDDLKLCINAAGLMCDENETCVDDTTDECDPDRGDQFCIGFCISNNTMSNNYTNHNDSDVSVLNNTYINSTLMNNTMNGTMNNNTLNGTMNNNTLNGTMNNNTLNGTMNNNTLDIADFSNMTIIKIQIRTKDGFDEIKLCIGGVGNLCAEGEICVDDPFDQCNPNNDTACIGFCLNITTLPQIFGSLCGFSNCTGSECEFNNSTKRPCGGMLFIECEEDEICVDDPEDSCFGEDNCLGFCAPLLKNLTTTNVTNTNSTNGTSSNGTSVLCNNTKKQLCYTASDCCSGICTDGNTVLTGNENLNETEEGTNITGIINNITQIINQTLGNLTNETTAGNQQQGKQKIQVNQTSQGQGQGQGNSNNSSNNKFYCGCLLLRSRCNTDAECCSGHCFFMEEYSVCVKNMPLYATNRSYSRVSPGVAIGIILSVGVVALLLFGMIVMRRRAVKSSNVQRPQGSSQSDVVV